MPEINKDLLLNRILHSGDFTALEKRYLEGLVKASPQKQGRWIKGMLDGEGYHCSECRIWKKTIILANYCQSCGAKMDGGDDHVGQNADNRKMSAE